MAVNLIDPNKNIGDGIKNGIPEYQKFIPYVELYVVKHNEVQFLINENGTADLINNGTNREVVSFLGYNQTSKLFTSEYTDDMVGEQNRFDSDEGFGITNIDIEIKSKFVPTVDITFIDIKGSSLLNEESKNLNSSKYSSIFQLPSPTFVLIMKGAYGKAVRYILHLLKQDVTFNSSNGNFEIKAKFVGKTFAPLSDIKMGWIKAAPYIGKNKPVTGDITKEIDHFYDLTIAGKELYDKLLQLTTSSKEVKNIAQANEDLGILNDLSKELVDTTGLSLNVQPIFVKDGTINGKTIVLSATGYPTELPVSEDLDNRIFQKFTMLYNRSDISDLVTLTDYLADKRDALLGNADYKRIIGDVNYSNSDIVLSYRYGLTDSGIDKKDQLCIFFDVTDYQTKIDNAKKKIAIDGKANEEEILNKVKQTTTENLGFEPNIRNVMRLLCDDIDLFFNLLRDAGKTSGIKNATNLPNSPADTLRVIDNEAWPRVTMKVQQGGFLREVAAYPGSDEVLSLYPDFANWGEVRFVEDFIDAYFKIKTFEEEINELKKEDNDGLKKIIPINPVDTEIFGEPSKDFSYVGKTSVHDIFITMLKRYFIATQYTYKGFWNIDGLLGDDEDAKNDLLNFISNAEAQNISTSVLDINTINSLITTLERSPDDFILGLQSSKEYKNDPFLNGTEGFSDGNKTFTLSNGTKYYSYKDNKEYEGLKLYENFNPQTDIIDASVVENSEKPTKYLIDFVNGGFFNRLFQKAGEKPKLNKENLLVFVDARKAEDKYDSDFFHGSITKDGSILAGIQGQGGTTYSDYIEYFEELHDKYENNPITDLTTFRDEIFNYELIRLQNGYSSIKGKFYFPGIIEMPLFYLISMGYHIKKNKDAGEIIGYEYLSEEEEKFYLSEKDEQFYMGFYEEYLKKETELLSSFNRTVPVVNYSEQTVKSSEILTYLMQSAFVINNTAFTYLDQEDSETIKDTNGIDLTLFHPLFENTNRLKRPQLFYDILQKRLLTLLKEKKKRNDQRKKDLNKVLRDGDLKTQLYYSFKSIYDRWIKGTEDFTASEYAYPYNGGSKLIDKFRFVDRGYNEIGDDLICDFQNLLDYSNNSDSEVYGGISAFLSKNQFDFFPIPNFIDFTNKKDAWENCFNTEETARIDTKPMFTCMYVGGFSSQSDDTISFIDPTKTPADMGDNVFAFNVNFGTQSQSIFKDIQLSTSEFKETGESLKLMDDIFNNLGQNQTPTPKGQNLFEVYENRSYSSTINVPLGNMLIQPTQYYELNNIPLFNGVYIILEVSHKISASSNRIETTFKGSRIKRYISPIVMDSLVKVTGVYSELNKYVTNLDQNTTIAQNNVLTINPSDFLIRKADKPSYLVVRQLNGGNYINDTRYLNFTTQTINRSGVSILPITKK